jgi:hypothetical protein
MASDLWSDKGTSRHVPGGGLGVAGSAVRCRLPESPAGADRLAGCPRPRNTMSCLPLGSSHMSFQSHSVTVYSTLVLGSTKGGQPCEMGA